MCPPGNHHSDGVGHQQLNRGASRWPALVLDSLLGYLDPVQHMYVAYSLSWLKLFKHSFTLTAGILVIQMMLAATFLSLSVRGGTRSYSVWCA